MDQSRRSESEEVTRGEAVRAVREGPDSRKWNRSVMQRKDYSMASK